MNEPKRQPKGGPRVLVAGMVLSAAALIGLATHENYTEAATIPTKGDRPTLGFGSTFHADGRPVRLGERTNPVQALRILRAHLAREEPAFRASLPGVALNQAEYDVYMDWVYQFGIANWQGSSMRRNLLRGQHEAACHSLLRWRKAGGYDCSTLVDGKPNRRCWGVWERQLERHTACMGAQ